MICFVYASPRQYAWYSSMFADVPEPKGSKRGVSPEPLRSPLRMFYYISFLRPPPPSSAPGSISFTPQIANDLRTELFPGTQDIYYTWLSSTDSIEDGRLKPRKLTTWSQAVAYKEISIALPPNARPGQFWKLLLSPSPSTRNAFVSLGKAHSTGREPFPVISMPIRITPKLEKSPAKQTQIERTYRVSLNGPGDLHCLLREQTSFDLDKVSSHASAWKAGGGADDSRKYGIVGLG